MLTEQLIFPNFLNSNHEIYRSLSQSSNITALKCLAKFILAKVTNLRLF